MYQKMQEAIVRPSSVLTMHLLTYLFVSKICIENYITAFQSPIQYALLASFLITCICFFRIAYSDPGYIPQAFDLDESPICDKCEQPKPTLSTHCSDCGRCVFLRYEHSSQINNCIGFCNFKESFHLGIVLMLFSVLVVTIATYSAVRAIYLGEGILVILGCFTVCLHSSIWYVFGADLVVDLYETIREIGIPSLSLENIVFEIFRSTTLPTATQMRNCNKPNRENTGEPFGIFIGVLILKVLLVGLLATLA